MHFESPIWLALLFLLPLIAGARILSTRQQLRLWRKFVAPRLSAKLFPAPKALHQWLRLVFVLGAFLLFSLTLSQPHGGTYQTKVITKSRNLILAIDLSRSMQTQDLSPNRLQQAKNLALDLIEQFPQDQIGLIAFSDHAWLAAPLTNDHQALRETLAEFSFHYLPTHGSHLEQPIQLAQTTFEKNATQDNALIIMSDGEDHESKASLKAAQSAAQKNMTIFTVGIGTEDGAFIPHPNHADGRFHDPRSGRPILSTLHEKSLRDIAHAGQGHYFNGAQESLSGSLYKELEQLAQSTKKQGSRTITKPYFQWFLGPTLILVLLCLIAPFSSLKPTSAFQP